MPNFWVFAYGLSHADKQDFRSSATGKQAVRDTFRTAGFVPYNIHSSGQEEKLVVSNKATSTLQQKRVGQTPTW
jgi:hypothetical protein